MKSLRELSDLKNRVALITGGAGHVGSVFAETLAELGASIILLDVDAKRCQDKSRELQQQFGVKSLALCVDLAQDKEMDSIKNAVLHQFDQLDIIINCAAWVGTSKLEGWAVPFETQKMEPWRTSIEINLLAPFHLIQTCYGILKKSGYGTVINVGSIYGMVGPRMSLYKDTVLGNPAAYAATKGGILQLTKWLACALAPHVRVNMITLGGIFRNHTDPFLSRYHEQTPLKRMATEEDLKGAIAYLASDLSAYVTGHNLVVDGGWTAW